MKNHDYTNAAANFALALSIFGCVSVVVIMARAAFNF